MTPSFPFKNWFPLGLGAKDRVRPPSILNRLGEIAAAAADGRIYSDSSQFFNWVGLNISARGKTALYDPVSRRWITMGITSSVTLSTTHTVSGATWVDGYSTTPGGGGTNAITCSGTDGAGLIGVGISRTIGGTSKIIRFPQAPGDFGSLIKVGTVNTAGPTALVYSRSFGLWMCSINTEMYAVDNFASVTVETDWTTIMLSGAPNHYIVRDNPSPLVLGINRSAPAASTSYLISTDGVIWTAQTFPVSLTIGAAKGWWDEYRGLFLIITSNGLYTSSTGLTGSWTLVDAAQFGGSIATMGRVVLRSTGNINVSDDINPSKWNPVVDTATGVLNIATSPTGVLYYDTANGDHFLSFQGGY